MAGSTNCSGDRLAAVVVATGPAAAKVVVIIPAAVTCGGPGKGAGFTVSFG